MMILINFCKYIKRKKINRELEKAYKELDISKIQEIYYELWK